jgi:cytochrome c peroxidase
MKLSAPSSTSSSRAEPRASTLRQPLLRGLFLLVACVGLACDDGESTRAGADTSTPSTHDAGDAAQPQGDAGSDAGGETAFALALPSDFPPLTVPDDNPLTEAKIELGRHLFYDKRLSGNETQACASCHKQELAFTDGRKVGLGSTGEQHVRGAMSLANVGYASTLTWANREMRLLERQALVPMFGEGPVELGLLGKEVELITRVKAVDTYQQLFPKAFPELADPFSIDTITRAIASFQRSLISGNSPYDRYSRGDASAISESAQRGEDLFFKEKFDCFHCHGGPTFSDQINHANQASGEEPFHNTGLYNLDLEGSYPQGNQGLYEETKKKPDKGRFKAPTLRNIAVTAPYMHDGSIATLEEVLDHYAAGGRTITEGPYAGSRGFDNPNKSAFVHGFVATQQERDDLLAFLRSLTDDEFLTNPKYSSPWPK